MSAFGVAEPGDTGMKFVTVKRSRQNTTFLLTKLWPQTIMVEAGKTPDCSTLHAGDSERCAVGITQTGGDTHLLTKKVKFP